MNCRADWKSAGPGGYSWQPAPAPVIGAPTAARRTPSQCHLVGRFRNTLTYYCRSALLRSRLRKRPHTEPRPSGSGLCTSSRIRDGISETVYLVCALWVCRPPGRPLRDAQRLNPQEEWDEGVPHRPGGLPHLISAVIPSLGKLCGIRMPSSASSWLQPVFSLLVGARTLAHSPKRPPDRRPQSGPQPGVPAPQTP
jgi:hypothetical protein